MDWVTVGSDLLEEISKQGEGGEKEGKAREHATSH